MRRILGLILGVALVVLIGTSIRKKYPASSVYLQTSMNRQSRPLSVSRSTASIVPEPVPSENKSSTNQNSYSNPPAAIKDRLLANLPTKLRERGSVNAQLSGFGIWSLSLALDNIPIERTDVRAERNSSGEWVLLQEPSFGELPDAPDHFPQVRSSEIEAIITNAIEKESATVTAIQLIGNIWLLGAGELVPCGQFDVQSIRNSDRLTREEIWCVQPSTNEVIWRRSIQRR